MLGSGGTGKVPAPAATTKSRQTASPLNTARLNKIGNKWLLLYALPCVELQRPNRKSIVSLASLSGSARGSIYTLSTKGCPWQPLRKYSGHERRGRGRTGTRRAGGTTDQRDSPLPGIPRATTPLGHPGIRPHGLRPETTGPSHAEAASERRGGRHAWDPDKASQLCQRVSPGRPPRLYLAVQAGTCLLRVGYQCLRPKKCGVVPKLPRPITASWVHSR